MEHVSFPPALMSQDLLNEARQRLAEIAKDPEKYSKLLEGLVLQVKYPAGVQGECWETNVCS